jgi:hypothetical protein
VPLPPWVNSARNRARAWAPLPALERDASPESLQDAEDEAAAQDWLARGAAGQTSYTPLAEVKRRLGLAQ